jgi:hypothetical protein
VLADMAQHGVEAVDCCAVDNVLAPLGDPLFAGHCAAGGAECGARMVQYSRVDGSGVQRLEWRCRRRCQSRSLPTALGAVACRASLSL